MSRLIYACRFDIQGAESAQAIFDVYEDWVEGHYSSKFGIELDFDLGKGFIATGSLPAGHRLDLTYQPSDKSAFHSIKWIFPADGDDTLLWRNELRVGIFDNFVALEHSISIESVDFKVTPALIDIGSPRVIRKICTEQTVRVGEMQIRATPYQLRVDGIKQFLDLLGSNLRRLPIVFIAPYTNDDSNIIDPAKIAASLSGVAVVVQAISSEVTWELADVLGRPLSCYDGAVRIYWPGFSADDNPRRHPLYLASRIAAVGPQSAARAIERDVFSVATFRFVPDPRINALVRAAEAAQRVEQLEERKKGTDEDWEAYALELDGELSEIKSRLTELEAENENLRANQKFVYSPDETADIGSLQDRPLREPTTNREAVEFALEDCSNLVLLQSALDGAKECPFRRPQEIYDALRDLDGVASLWNQQRQEAGSGGDLRQHLKSRGWGKRCSMQISDTTRKRFGNDYTFEYNGKRQLFEPHITLGSGDPNNCASIHFAQDEVAGKIIVAYVGRHLPNTKT